MSDLRGKQPQEKTFDYTRQTSGNHTYRINLWVATYSGIKSEDVYVKHPEYLIKAMTFHDAVGYANVLAGAISEAHDVWKTEVQGVSRK